LADSIVPLVRWAYHRYFRRGLISGPARVIARQGI